MNFVACERQYFDHLKPLYDRLGGSFYVSKQISDYAKGFIPESITYGSVNQLRGLINNFTIISSYRDLINTRKRGVKQILIEHGCGQTYRGGNSGSYANSVSGKENVVLYLAVNDHAAESFKRVSDIPCEVIGCPKLDGLVKIKKPSDDTIAISFHWDCIVSPESRSSFYYYKDILPELAERFKIIGHGHPRIIDEIAPYYERAGIEVVRDFKEVCERASVYVADNTSTLFEFAALARPVVVLNCPKYRKTAEHGLRFWECANVGINCEDPLSLVRAIDSAIKYDEYFKDNRASAVEKVYPYLKGSVNRAVSIIRSYTNGDYNA